MRKVLKTLSFYGLLIALLASFIPVTYAQLYSSGCHPDFVDKISATTSRVDFEAMCEAYVECGGDTTCILPALDSIADSCENDADCEAEATLYAAVIDLFNNPDLAYSLTLDMLPIDQVVEGLNLIQAQDFEAALVVFEAIETSYAHPGIPVILGEIHHFMGDLEQAIEQFDRAISLSLNDPVAYLFRAREYAALGDPRVALDLSVFYSLLQQTDAPILTEEFAEIVGEFPLDTAYEGEAWLWYPVQDTSVSPGGDVVTDRADEAPSEVMLYQVDENTLALDGLPLTSEYILVPSLVALTSEEDETYTLEGTFFQDDSTITLTLTPTDDDRFAGTLNMTGFEFSVTTQFILAPADSPDPRP